MNQNYKNLYIAFANKIYAKYNPEKIQDLPALFEKYRNREKELIEQICKKYSVENHELISFTKEYKQVFYKAPRNNNTTILIIFSCAAMVAIALICWTYFKDKNGSNNTLTTEIVQNSESTITETDKTKTHSTQEAKSKEFNESPIFISSKNTNRRYTLLEIANPKDIIREQSCDKAIQEIIKNKDGLYSFENTEEGNIIVTQLGKEITYYYNTATERLEGVTYFSYKAPAEIRTELAKYGFTFENMLESDISDCYSVRLEQVADRVKVEYGYECD